MATYLDELVQKITTKADLKGFDDLDRKQKRAIKSNDLLAKSFRRAFGIFFGIQGIRNIVQTYTKLDDLQRVLNGISGGAEEGAKQFAFLKREAFRTATDIDIVAESYKNFYSAAKGAGFSMGQAQGMFSAILTAGRGIGANQQQIGGALVALEQMLSKGKVSAEELRKQLGNALPGAMQIAARAMGVTNQQFQEMLKNGISSVEFVQKFAQQAEKELGKNLAENVKSLNSELTNLATAWKLLIYETMKEGGTGESLAKAVREITKLLVSPTLHKALNLIGKALAFVIKHIKLILLLFGIKKLVEYTFALKKLHLALWEIATTTNSASTATQLLATSYAMMTSGQIGAGFKNLAKGLWAMCVPALKLAGIFAGIVTALLLLQDLWLTYANPKADTYFRDLINAKGEKAGVVAGEATIGASVGGLVGGIPGAAVGAGVGAISGHQGHEMIKHNSASYGTPYGGGQPFYIRDEDTLPYKINQLKNKYFGTTSGGAAPIPLFNTELETPSSGVVGTLPNLSGNYNNSDTKSMNNNITINISAPNSQPETIAQSVNEALGDFFKLYNMRFS